MTASARTASVDDLGALVGLFRELESEMVGLKPIWSFVDGLSEPVADSLAHLLANPGDFVYVGEYSGVPVGFLVWSDESLLGQAGAERIAVVRYIFTSQEAREVGVGEAMISRCLTEARDRGIRLFDAVVSPGHRLAKNFFESHGFKARRIVMHRDERPEPGDVE